MRSHTLNRSESTLCYIWQHFPVNNQSTEYTDGSNIFLVIFILSFFLVTKMTFLLNTSKELATLSFTIITYRIGYQSYQNLNIGNNFSNFYGFSSSVRSSDTFFDAGLDLAYNFSCSIPMRKSKTHLLQNNVNFCNRFSNDWTKYLSTCIISFAFQCPSISTTVTFTAYNATKKFWHV